MSELNWYVVSVRSCQERRVAEKLLSREIEAYVPVQTVHRKWSDRIKVVDKLLLPGLVFIHCDKSVRATIFEMVSGLAYFLIDRASDGHKPLVIPDKQMMDFMMAVRAYSSDGDLTIAEQGISKGDTVRIIRGPLVGFICECVEIQSRRKLIIRLGPIGSLLVTVPASDVVKV